MSFIFGASTEMFVVEPDFSRAKSIPFPLGVTSLLGQIPTGGNVGGRQYVVGGHTSNLLIDEHDRCLRQSIPAPPDAPTVVLSGSGSTPQICYTRFYDELTDERSPLSAGTVVTGGLTRSWGSLPTVVPGDSFIVDGTVTFAAGTVTGVTTKFTLLRPGDRIAISTATNRWARIRTIVSDTSMTIDDTGMAGAGVTLVVKAVSRVSHVELWVAVNGALPRLAIRVRLGTAAVSESVATLALGEAETTSFAAMPYGSGAVLYNKRQLVIGVVGREDRVFLSKIGFHERYEGLNLKTEYGEPIVGAFRHRKYVVLICPDSSYVVQGVADEDYVLTGLDPDIGGYGASVSAEGVAYVPGRQGMQLFNGAFHRAIPKRRGEWTRLHDTYQLAMERGFMAVNPDDETVQFYPNSNHLTAARVQEKGTVWVGAYGGVGAQDSGSVSTPRWYNDHQYLATVSEYVTYARYLRAAGTTTGAFYRCGSTGKVYAEDKTDAVALTAPITLILGHMLLGDFGGDMQEGKELIRFWTYQISRVTCTARIWLGDEYAAPLLDWDPNTGVDEVDPSYSDSIGANRGSLVDEVVGTDDRGQPVVVHVHPVVNKCARGFTMEYIWNNASGVVFIGLGGFVNTKGVINHPPKLQDGVIG